MKYNFHKVKVDFDYNNELRTIIAEPYFTLLELKESVLKKIFPPPKDVHCYYQNLDLSKNEDEQISKLFPFKRKIKINLKKPAKEKKMVKSYKSFEDMQIKMKYNIVGDKMAIPRIILNSHSTADINSKNKIKSRNVNSNPNMNMNVDKKKKKNLFSFSPLLINNKENNKSKLALETVEEEYFKNNELFYYLHKNKFERNKLLNKKKR